MGSQGPHNATSLQPLKSIVISAIQHTPLYKSQQYLYQKYVIEKLSTTEIAELIFSARSTISKYLGIYNIPLREDDQTSKKRPGFGLAYGKRIVKRQEVLHKREQGNIKKMKDLRAKGFSYWKIAEVLNSMSVPTQTAKGKWHAKTVHQILNPKK